MTVRCTGLFSLDGPLGESTKAFGTAVSFLAFGLAMRTDAEGAERLLGLNAPGLGEEGKAASGKTASDCTSVNGLFFSAGCGVAAAPGETAGAGMLLGAAALAAPDETTGEGMFLVTETLLSLVTFTTVVFDVAATIAGQIITMLLTGRPE